MTSYSSSSAFSITAALLSLIFLGTPLPALAQAPPSITIRKSDSVNISNKGISGANGAAINQVLSQDLKIAGYFADVDAARASYILSGQSAGSQLQGIIQDNRGNTILTKSYSGPVRSMAHQFADDIVETLTDHTGIATSKIAFVSNRTGQKEIYLADYDGANVQQLTRDKAISVAPSLSPDGKNLAYTGYQSGYADIYTVSLSNGARSRVVKFPGTNSGAAWSPDSSRIALSVSRDGNPELYVVGSNGRGARRLTRTRGVESSPTWGPGGKEIIYVSDDRGSPALYRISASGGNGQIIPTGHSYNTEPSWSPDGQNLAFVVRSGGFSIATKNLRTGQTSTVAGSAVDPSWAPNSRHLIYASSSGSSLIILDTKTGKTYPVISSLGEVSEPSWAR
ncbi:MAG: biopolymer transporter Tol [Chthoniobacterales bacterium]